MEIARTTGRFFRTQSSLAWLIWGLAAAYFFSDYLARVSPGVMSRDLQIAFSVSASGLGLLSSFFYYPYILMQIPVGLLVDRYSVRWLLTLMALLTAVGCAVFGLAGTLWVAAFGRVLIGFSAAFAFVSALRLAATWFPPERLGLLAGLTQALGMWGAAFGDAPVSYLLEQVGWRHSMLLMAFVFIVLAILIFRFIQDAPTELHGGAYKAMAKKDKEGVLDSLGNVLTNRLTWFNAVYAGLLFAPTAVLGEFWGPAYLQYGRGLSGHQAAFANSLIFIGWGIGGPLAGWISDRLGRRKPLMYFSAIAGAVIMSLILFMPGLSTTGLMFLFFLFGLTNIGVAVAYAVATEIVPRKTVGASIAFANMSSIMIGAILQPLFGNLLEALLGHKVIDIGTLTAADFSQAVLIFPVCSILALFMAFFVKETHCSPMREN